MNNTNKIVFLSVMVSMALVLSIVDSKIPILPLLPGIKLGLANIITIIILRFYRFKDAVTVLVVRCFFAFFFHGSFVALILSVSGGMLSVFIMFLLFKRHPDYFSLTGISICGGVAHNIGQILAASFIIQTSLIMVCFPYLLVVGAVSGYCIGHLSMRCCRFIERYLLFQ